MHPAGSLFLSKNGFKKQVRVGEKQVLNSTSFYQEGMKEANKLVFELRKRN
jgi:hypothetical protein